MPREFRVVGNGIMYLFISQENENQAANYYNFASLSFPFPCLSSSAVSLADIP